MVLDIRNRTQLTKPVRQEFEQLIAQLNNDFQDIQEALAAQGIDLAVAGDAGVIDLFHGDVSFGTNDSGGTSLATKVSTFTLIDANGLSPTDPSEVRVTFGGPWNSLGTSSEWILSFRVSSASQVTFDKSRLSGAAGSDLPSTHYFTVEWVRRISS